jgi:hypothetical protein
VFCSVRYAVSASAEAPAEDNLAIAMASFNDNPFAALTIVVAPAILTSATSTLCLGTNNRLGRVVDRTRVVSAQLAHLAPNGQNRAMCQRQLEALEVRWTLVLRALRFFYISLGSFAAAALMSLFGSLFTVSALRGGFTAIALLGLLSGTLGVAGLVAGCAMMMQETRLAIQNLAEEVQKAAYP